MSDLDRLVRRLRQVTPRAWQSEGLADRVRALAHQLAAIGDEGHVLPEVPDHALPDVIAVLGADALESDPASATRALAGFLADGFRGR